MKRFIFILIAVAITVRVSAQAPQVLTGVARGVDKATKNVERTVNNQVNRRIGNQSNTQLKGVSGTKLILPNKDMLLNDLIIGYSFGNDSIVVTFVMKTDSTALASSNNNKSVLKQLRGHSSANPGEHVYKGKTALGDGVYIFSSTYSTLRVIPANSPLFQHIYVRK